MACHHLATDALAGSGAFFAFGLAGGLHCVGMCGPLACLLGKPEEQPLSRLGLYQGGRIAAYAVIGAFFAAVGRPWQPVLTWPVLAVIAALPLMAYAFFADAGAPGFLSKAYGAVARRLAPAPPALRALGLGLLTPLLPCGLLYAAAGAAVAAPSPLLGAAWMAAFAAGTLPLLALGQAGFAFAAQRRPQSFVLGLRRAAALLAAGTILALSFLN